MYADQTRTALAPGTGAHAWVPAPDRVRRGHRRDLAAERRQVYTTLSRLERDGLVEPLGESVEGRLAYRITDAGRAEVASWFEQPVPREGRPRDELAIKLALSLTTPGIDVHRVVQVQRTQTLRSLQEYTRLKAGADPIADAAWLLVLDAMVFQAEAEVRWLDHCETRIAALPKPVKKEAASHERARTA